MDYVASICNNIGFILAVEKLLGIEKEIPERAKVAEVILFELGRIESHLIGIGTNAMDLGAVSAFLYCFKERERIYDILEMVCGARLTTSYPRVGGLPDDLPERFEEAIQNFLKAFPTTLAEVDKLLTRNRIWVERTKGVAYISAEDAIDLGLTGPALRGSGVPYDVRKAMPYLGYENYDFEIPISTGGDAYARYLCRLEEMHQSLRIIEQCLGKLEKLGPGPVDTLDPRVRWPAKGRVFNRMEELIQQFKSVTEGPRVPAGEAYHAIESANGELGFYVVSDGTAVPVKVRCRPPSFINLPPMRKMLKGALLADLIPTFDFINMVGGECDR
jgi:NADH-quinone oxidoreductase subunit D